MKGFARERENYGRRKLRREEEKGKAMQNKREYLWEEKKMAGGRVEDEW